MIRSRGLLALRPHPDGGQAIGRYLTVVGNKMMERAEHTASELENDVGSNLIAAEKKTPLRLLQKVYLLLIIGVLGL